MTKEITVKDLAVAKTIEELAIENVNLKYQIKCLEILLEAKEDKEVEDDVSGND